MKTRAAVAWEAGKPLEIEMLDLEGPKAGEVLVRNVASGVCHTDAFTLSGEDPEGIFPAVLGHEGGAVVEEIGEGVTSVKVGDHVIPLYTPECGECRFCRPTPRETLDPNRSRCLRRYGAGRLASHLSR